MHVIREHLDLEDIPDPELQKLLTARIEETVEFVDHFSELVTFLIVEPGDGIDVVDAALGFPVLANRFDGSVFGAANFSPSWDALEEHTGWFELVFVLSDDGAGVQLFISRAAGAPDELLAMCARYATPAEQGADS